MPLYLSFSKNSTDFSNISSIPTPGRFLLEECKSLVYFWALNLVRTIVTPLLN